MNKIYTSTVLLLLLLAVLHIVGGNFNLYIRYPGYDIMMHILGGIGIALSAYSMFTVFFKGWRPSMYFIITSTLIAGLAWELFEYYYDIAGAPVGTLAYYVDTIKDILDDLLGAIIATIFIKK